MPFLVRATRHRVRAIAYILLCVSPTVLIAARAQAQDTLRVPPADSARLDSLRRMHGGMGARLHAVTVTASRADPQGPTSTTHVSQRAVEMAPAASPWELLRQTAGVEVHQQGQGPGFASDASLRGFSSDHSTDLALWIDGVPINEPVNGHAEGYNDWSVIFPEAVSDIDVIRGPTSALFGNFALAGVVNVRTVERMAGSEVVATAGSYGRADVSLLSGFDHGAAGGGVFGLRARHEDGFRPNARNDLLQGHARIVRDVTATSTIDAGAELYGARWRSPGYLSEAEFAARDYGIVSNPSDGGYKRRAQERVSLRVVRGQSLAWRTTAYATQGDWQLYLTIPPTGGQFEGTGSQTEEEDRRIGAGLTSALTYDLASAHFTLGTEARFDRAHYRNYFTTLRVRDSVDALVTARQLSGALFAQSGISVGPRLRLDLGARYDLFHTQSQRGTPGDLDVSATRGVFTPKVGALARISPDVGVYANVSRGFRATDGVITDPGLPFITEWAYEAGVKLDRGALYLSATAFRMDVSNEQTFNPLAAGSVSGGASRRRGAELELRAPFGALARVSGDWTFNDARYTRELAAPDGGDPEAAPVDLARLRIYNTARYVGSATLDIGPQRGLGRWTLQASGNWVGPYSPFDEPGIVAGGYGLLHLSGRYALTPAMVIDVGVRNVLDRSYPEVIAGHLVAPGEPRSIFAALRWRVP